MCVCSNISSCFCLNVLVKVPIDRWLKKPSIWITPGKVWILFCGFYCFWLLDFKNNFEAAVSVTSSYPCPAVVSQLGTETSRVVCGGGKKLEKMFWALCRKHRNGLILVSKQKSLIKPAQVVARSARPGFICVVPCLWSSIIPVSRQLAALSCSPTLHHHRNLRSIWMVALSLHPSARQPKTEIHNKHNRAVETNNTHAERYVRKTRIHTGRDRAPTPDASAQQSKCVCVCLCVLKITHTHTHIWFQVLCGWTCQCQYQYWQQLCRLISDMTQGHCGEKKTKLSALLQLI